MKKWSYLLPPILRILLEYRIERRMEEALMVGRGIMGVIFIIVALCYQL